MKKHHLVKVNYSTYLLKVKAINIFQGLETRNDLEINLLNKFNDNS